MYVCVGVCLCVSIIITSTFGAVCVMIRLRPQTTKAQSSNGSGACTCITYIHLCTLLGGACIWMTWWTWWQNGEQTASGRWRIASVLFLNKLIGSGGTVMPYRRHSAPNSTACGSHNGVSHYSTAGIAHASVASIETGRANHHARWFAYDGLRRQGCMHCIAPLGS